MSWLLDVNFLLASRWTTHPDHDAVRTWLDAQPEFHTTPIAELGFLRVSLSPGYSASWEDTQQSLASLLARPAHRFLADDLSATDLPKTRYRDTKSTGSGLWHGLTGSAREILRKHLGQSALELAENLLEAVDLDCSGMPELSHWPTCRPVGKRRLVAAVHRAFRL